MREGRKGREGQTEKGHREGEHGRCQNPRRKRHSPKESKSELSSDVGESGRDRVSSPVGRHDETRHVVDAGRRQGHGLGHEVHEPRKDLGPDGQIREGFRRPRRADVGDGGRHEPHDGHQCAARRRRGPYETGGRRGRTRAEHGPAVGGVEYDFESGGHGQHQYGAGRVESTAGEAETSLT